MGDTSMCEQLLRSGLTHALKLKLNLKLWFTAPFFVL